MAEFLTSFEDNGERPEQHQVGQQPGEPLYEVVFTFDACDYLSEPGDPGAGDLPGAADDRYLNDIDRTATNPMEATDCDTDNQDRIEVIGNVATSGDVTHLPSIEKLGELPLRFGWNAQSKFACVEADPEGGHPTVILRKQESRFVDRMGPDKLLELSVEHFDLLRECGVSVPPTYSARVGGYPFDDGEIHRSVYGSGILTVTQYIGSESAPWESVLERRDLRGEDVCHGLVRYLDACSRRGIWLCDIFNNEQYRLADDGPCLHDLDLRFVRGGDRRISEYMYQVEEWLRAIHSGKPSSYRD